MRSKPFGWVSMVGVALLAISLACGGGGGGSSTPEVPVAPTITSFTADPISMEAGTSTALIGIFANGRGVITPGNLPVYYSGYSATVWPTSTTTYTLTVTSPSGAQVSQTTKVTVTPSITNFRANHVIITAGGAAVLEGSFAYGTGIITPGNQPVVSGFSIEVAPTATTTYTLTVTNETGDTATESVTVQVVDAPVISSFTANPSSIALGGASELTGNFANGTGILTPGRFPMTSGNAFPVWPTDTTTFTLTVTNPASGAVTTQTATVTVIGGIRVFAGKESTPGNSDGTGSGARFNQPQGIARDGSGNLYVADTHNYTIRKVTPEGVVSTLAGTPGVPGNADGSGAAASFNSPKAVAVDAFRNVYVADTGNNSIRKITPTGMVSTLASGFSSPTGVAVDALQTVYVADTIHHTICMITPGGLVSVLAGMTDVPGNVDATGTAARFNSPQSLALDSAGNVYVSDYTNGSIRKISSTGVVTPFMGTLSGDLALDGVGNIYVASSPILKLTPSGQFLATAGDVAMRFQGITLNPTTGTCFSLSADAVWEIPATSFIPVQ